MNEYIKIVDNAINYHGNKGNIMVVEVLKGVRTRMTSIKHEFKHQAYGYWKDENGKTQMGTIPRSCPYGMVDTCCSNPEDCQLILPTP